MRELGMTSDKCPPWQLPCIMPRDSTRKMCECSFLAHVPRADWESLHDWLGSSLTRHVLTRCSIFVFVEQRIWLQVSGPIGYKGRLETAFPLRPYRAANVCRPTKSSSYGSGKRKRPEDSRGSVNAPQPHMSNEFSSVIRPAKKIKLDPRCNAKDLLTVPRAVASAAFKVPKPSLLGPLRSVPPEVKSLVFYSNQLFFSSSWNQFQPNQIMTSDPQLPLDALPSVLKPFKKFRQVRLDSKSKIVEYMETKTISNASPV